MSDLRLKIRNKIYTSGNHIIDTKNNNNCLIVFIGEKTCEELKSYVDDFLKNTLKSQIPDNKITYVMANKENIDDLPELIARAVKTISFNPTMSNELFISFVTLMDDDIHNTEHKIELNVIEELKTSTLGGYSVDFNYDFYGIFTSVAKYENRLNAKKTILHFLKKENGGLNARKRIYHQSCPGDDFYRSAKSVTFMILISLINKLDHHLVADSIAEGESYTWTTFALFEKNLASLVIYEMINKLLNNQRSGAEMVSNESLIHIIHDELLAVEGEFKKIASVSDIEYLPVIIKRTERKLTAVEKAKNLFSSEKISPVSYRKSDEDVSVNSLLEQQKKALVQYIEEHISEAYIDNLVLKLIKQCTIMNSINNSSNEALILSSLESCKRELDANKNIGNGPMEILSSADYYIPKYNKMILTLKSEILDRIIEYFRTNINYYVEKVQNHWNEMNIEVSNMINDFATFQNYFDGINDLISDKYLTLLSEYDDILKKIDISSVIKAIDKDSHIYSNILSSYYDNVKVAGDIARKFGNRNITPDINNMIYCLFSNSMVECPGNLKLIADDYWFREHEISILFTAKNNINDCGNLPYNA